MGTDFWVICSLEHLPHEIYSWETGAQAHVQPRDNQDLVVMCISLRKRGGWCPYNFRAQLSDYPTIQCYWRQLYICREENGTRSVFIEKEISECNAGPDSMPRVHCPWQRMETGTGEQQLPGNSAAGSGTTHSIRKQARRVMWAQSRICQGTYWLGLTLSLCLRHIQPLLA